ncbi:MAG: hypothetical protein LBM97_01505 [Candidatus Nomurabacteria bacterium]|jgi:hypothetical protein|nr:hypothetical protein [Candidatus Nomurabacteria bacterium]
MEQIKIKQSLGARFKLWKNAAKVTGRKVSGGVTKHALPIAFGSSAVLLALVLTTALVSNRASSSALDTQFDFNATSSTVAIYADGDINGHDYSTTVLATADGAVSSIASNIRVVTSGTYGYSLALSSATANMVGQANSGNTLTPLPNASIENPGAFSSVACNTWGFATPKVSGDFAAAFDSTYAVANSQAVASHTSKYAAVPTTTTTIHQGASQDETRPYYFAACVNSAQPADDYRATVTWTAYALDAPTGVGSTIVNLDAGMVPVRWDYDNCSYGTNNVTSPLGDAACWVKADPSIHDSNSNNDWYSYTTDTTATKDGQGQSYFLYRKMANAVTFTDSGKLNTYKTAAAGTPIPNSDIAGYWAYIPRFEYKVENLNYNSANYPHAFDVRLTNATGAVAGTNYVSVATYDATVGTGVAPATPRYLTPPAFTAAGSTTGTELNGIWFGKFESTGTLTAPTILPRQQPSSGTLSSLFNAGLLIGKTALTGTRASYPTGATGNQHNLVSAGAHITKNSEWGLITYFTQSMYGVCSNMNCTSDGAKTTGLATAANMERVRNNAYNSTPYQTACGPNSLTSTDDAAYTSLAQCGTYNTQLGTLAATSHNVYGLYDTAGGVWEYTTGGLATGNGNAADAYTIAGINASVASGFIGTDGNTASNYNNYAIFGADASVYSKYFDIYLTPSIDATANASITGGRYGLGFNPTAVSAPVVDNANWNIYANKMGLGQAIFEASQWSNAYAYSVGATNPWFVRGGHANSTTVAGVESISVSSGGSVASVGWRAALVVSP